MQKNSIIDVWQSSNHAPSASSSDNVNLHPAVRIDPFHANSQFLKPTEKVGNPLFLQFVDNIRFFKYFDISISISLGLSHLTETLYYHYGKVPEFRDFPYFLTFGRNAEVWREFSKVDRPEQRTAAFIWRTDWSKSQ